MNFFGEIADAVTGAKPGKKHTKKHKKTTVFDVLEPVQCFKGKTLKNYFNARFPKEMNTIGVNESLQRFMVNKPPLGGQCYDARDENFPVAMEMLFLNNFGALRNFCLAMEQVCMMNYFLTKLLPHVETKSSLNALYNMILSHRSTIDKNFRIMMTVWHRLAPLLAQEEDLLELQFYRINNRIYGLLDSFTSTLTHMQYHTDQERENGLRRGIYTQLLQELGREEAMKRVCKSKALRFFNSTGGGQHNSHLENIKAMMAESAAIVAMLKAYAQLNARKIDTLEETILDSYSLIRSANHNLKQAKCYLILATVFKLLTVFMIIGAVIGGICIFFFILKPS